ncbi:uncharacterized protein EI90DRAFT_3055300 [Cantharellus anzutake]|uniref:uncharacterized protein n=1 Tax=Cantharellus anzutake TaxID=1750568 RepID=UPI001906A739|nr:uncharacterized protein EI90DRAFT_3055300 [Cantharellus anzutake]KAF8332362.1 hypothetical protein EI90DRAFT_3055300 [Cantharellus anzutake]
MLCCSITLLPILLVTSVLKLTLGFLSNHAVVHLPFLLHNSMSIAPSFSLLLHPRISAVHVFVVLLHSLLCPLNLMQIYGLFVTAFFTLHRNVLPLLMLTLTNNGASSAQHILNQYYLTSSQQLSTLVCAVCAAAKPSHEFVPNSMQLSAYDTDLLVSVYPNHGPNPFSNTPSLHHIMICPEGVVSDCDGHFRLRVCLACHRAWRRHRLPPTAMANNLYLGPFLIMWLCG